MVCWYSKSEHFQVSQVANIFLLLSTSSSSCISLSSLVTRLFYATLDILATILHCSKHLKWIHLDFSFGFAAKTQTQVLSRPVFAFCLVLRQLRVLGVLSSCSHILTNHDLDQWRNLGCS